MINWIVIDVSYIVYRAQYASREGNAIYGFIATVMNLKNRFDSDHFVFCFDRGQPLRKSILPGYKERDRDPKHQDLHRAAKVCMQTLRMRLLEQWGFRNVFSQPGYEGDDIIASVVQNSKCADDDEFIIISSDRDLYQLLNGKRVVMYNPTKEEIINEQTFSAEWEVTPAQWSYVKAIAGDASDNIPGLKGIGLKTAARFINRTLGPHTKAYDIIANSSLNEFKDRERLIRLPLKGVDIFALKDAEDINWEAFRSYAPS